MSHWLPVLVHTPAHAALGPVLTYRSEHLLPAGTLVRVPLGKRETFQRAVLFSIIPMFAITLIEPVPLYVVLLVTSTLFFAMNARMIPGMALLTSAANPKFRGTFMSLNGAVQSFSMGVAAWVGGMLLQSEPSGQVTHYWLCAVVATCASLLAYVLAKRVSMHE